MMCVKSLPNCFESYAVFDLICLWWYCPNRYSTHLVQVLTEYMKIQWRNRVQTVNKSFIVITMLYWQEYLLTRFSKLISPLDKHVIYIGRQTLFSFLLHVPTIILLLFTKIQRKRGSSFFSLNFEIK